MLNFFLGMVSAYALLFLVLRLRYRRLWRQLKNSPLANKTKDQS